MSKIVLESLVMPGRMRLHFSMSRGATRRRDVTAYCIPSHEKQRLDTKTGEQELGG